MNLTVSEQNQTFTLGAAQESYRAALEKLQKDRFGERLWAKDASLWKTDEAHRKIILNSLGWLTVAESMSAHLKDLSAFSDEIRAEGFTDVQFLSHFDILNTL
jgi:hypothetical protein